MTFEIEIPDQAHKQIKVQLVMALVFALMFMPLLFDLVLAVTFRPQPIENRVFGVFVISFIVFLILLVGWKSFLLAIHVKHVNEDDGVLVMKRVFAPELRITKSAELRSYASAVPSLSAPYFRRGTVYWDGTTVCYISEYLPDAERLSARLTNWN